MTPPTAHIPKACAAKNTPGTSHGHLGFLGEWAMALLQPSRPYMAQESGHNACVAHYAIISYARAHTRPHMAFTYQPAALHMDARHQTARTSTRMLCCVGHGTPQVCRGGKHHEGLPACLPTYLPRYLPALHTATTQFTWMGGPIATCPFPSPALCVLAVAQLKRVTPATRHTHTRCAGAARAALPSVWRSYIYGCIGCTACIRTCLGLEWLLVRSRACAFATCSLRIMPSICSGVISL